MSDVDKTTIKIRAYSGKAEGNVPQSNLTEEQNNALELVKKTAQLEEVKGKLLEQLKINVQLRESLKQEQAKTAEMAEKAVMLESKLKELAGMETRATKVTELEAKVKELSEVLGKISGIASTGKSS
jgi:predicted nuclease with TOPRIM domain